MFRTIRSRQRDPFGRLMPPAKPEPEIAGLTNLFKLTESVGVTAPNRRRDVAKVETLMGRTGHLDLRQTDGATGYYGERLKQAVERFQKDTGLKKDGLINPRGETIRALQEHHKPGGQGAPEKRREQNCQQLRRDLATAQAERRAAEYLHDETSKAVNEKQDQLNDLYEAYKKAAAGAVIGLMPSAKVAKIGARILGKNIKLPDRDMTPPSDPSEAIAAHEAYSTATHEFEILISERTRAVQLLDQARLGERKAQQALSVSGCKS